MLAFSVSDTIPRFVISIDLGRQLELVTFNVIFSVDS